MVFLSESRLHVHTLKEKGNKQQAGAGADGRRNDFWFYSKCKGFPLKGFQQQRELGGILHGQLLQFVPLFGEKVFSWRGLS